MATRKRRKKCNLQELSLQNEQYTLKIAYRNKVEEVDSKPKSLLFVARYMEREIFIPIKDVVLEDSVSILTVVVEKSQYDAMFIDGDFWDVYIYIDMGLDEEAKKFRVKSSTQLLEMFYYLHPTEDRMLVPYTTNKGNLSIKSAAAGPIAKVEKMELLNNGDMELIGFAFHPRWQAKFKRRIILKDANDVIEKIYEIPFINRPDLEKQYNQAIVNFERIGFRLRLNTKSLLSEITGKINLKAYVEFVYTYNDEQLAERKALKCFQLDEPFTPQMKIMKVNNQKKKVRLTRTKKAKTIMLAVNDYYYKTELKKKIKSKITKIKRGKKIKSLYKKAFILLGLLPAKRNLVMFESFLGKQYSDNPRALYEYLKENHPEYKLYWSVDKKFEKNFIGKDINYIRRFSVKWLFTMARAKYWVTNSRMPLWIPKPSHTTYLQTWHGTPLKRLAADMDEVHMPGTSTKKYKRNFLKEASNWDYLVSPNAYSSEIFARAFAFDRKMIESGYPRNDFLIQSNNKETIKKLKQSFDVPTNKKVILYAPTWRDNQFYAKGKYKFDLELDLEKLRLELGDEYVVILRMHYLVAENIDLTPFEGFAYDFSNHADIRELYLIADMLITDYSSVFFDYANLRRPMLFFVYDIETYRDNLRGFYFNFEEQAPGPLVMTTEEVIDQVRQFDAEMGKLPVSFEAFYNKFCYLEQGESSKRVVEEVFLKN